MRVGLHWASPFAHWIHNIEKTMQTFGILGFIFGLVAFAIVTKLAKDVKNLQAQLDELKKQLPAKKNPDQVL